MDPDLKTFRVSVPARSDFVHVLRAVIASVASRLDMPFDLVEELRICVAEASALLLAVAQEGSLDMAVEAGSEGLSATLSVRGDLSDWPDEAVRSSWPWRVLTGLCETLAWSAPTVARRSDSRNAATLGSPHDPAGSGSRTRARRHPGDDRPLPAASRPLCA